MPEPITAMDLELELDALTCLDRVVTKKDERTREARGNLLLSMKRIKVERRKRKKLSPLTNKILLVCAAK